MFRKNTCYSSKQHEPICLENGVLLFAVQHEINVYARSQYCEKRLLAPSCLLGCPPARPHGTALLPLTDFHGFDI